MANVDPTIAIRLGGNSYKKRESTIFSGGFGSKILDLLTVPQYALTGYAKTVVQGGNVFKNVAESIRTKQTPADLLGVENGLARFALDVALDPLMFVGFGATVKGAKGITATTMAAQAAKNQRALVTLFGKSAVRGERVFQAITVGAERLKQSAPFVNDIVGKFGGRRALQSIAGEFTPEAIETAAKRVDFTMRQRNLREYQIARKIGESADFSVNYDLEVTKAAKQTGKTRDEIEEQITKWIYDNKNKVDGVPEDFLRRIDGKMDELAELSAKIGLDVLDEYKLPGVLRREVQSRLDGIRVNKGITLTREVPMNVANEEFKAFSGLKNARGETFGAYATKMGATLANDVRLDAVAVGKKGEQTYYYMPTQLKHVFNRLTGLKEYKTDLVEQIAKDEKTLTKLKQAGNTMEVKAMETRISYLKQANKQLREVSPEEAVQLIRDSNPEMVFERFDIGPFQANKVAKKLRGEELFETRAGKLISVRERALAKKEAAVEFADAMLEGAQTSGIRKLKRGEAIPAGYSELEFTKSIGKKGRYVAPTEVAEVTDRVYTKFTSIKEVGQYLAWFDKANSLIKGTLTYMNPAFHTRNFVSNTWQASYHIPWSGMGKYAEYIAESADIQRKMRKGAKLKGNAMALLNKKERKIMKEFISEGLGGVGWAAADIDTLMGKLQRGKVFSGFQAAGAFIEDASKYALFKYAKEVDKMAKPEAASLVRKLLFDYQDLTSFEREVMKRVMPFYTWTRKNLPLQVSMLIQKPGKFTRIGHAQDAIEDTVEGNPMDSKYMPDWLAEAYPVYIGTGEDGLQKFIKLEGFIPAVDINMIGRPWEIVVNGANPLIKLPTELVLNYDTFTERQIRNFKGERKRFLGMNIDPRLEKVLTLARPLNEISKLTGGADFVETPEFEDRLMNFIVGKTYDYSPHKQRQLFQYLQGLEESKIKKEIEQARRRGDVKEAKRLRDVLRAVQRGENVKI